MGIKLSSVILPGTIIFLYGPLGVGKTTFVRGFLKGLGFDGKVKSPTYTLVEPYLISQQAIFHFDFYRIQNPKELEYIGIQDYFSPQTICFIEWPKQGLAFLPAPDIDCYFSFSNSKEGREIRMEGRSLRGEEILIKCFHGM